MNWRLCLIIAATAAGGSFQFYNYSVVNNAQITLVDWIVETYTARGTTVSSAGMTALWSFLVSVWTLGGLCGALGTKFVAERAGRRLGLLVAALAAILGCGLEALAMPIKSPEILIIGRWVVGISAGLNCGLVPLYLTEIAPVEVRGAAGTAHQIAIAFGDWFGFFLSLPEVLGSATLWPLSICFSVIPATLLCLALPWFPESSRFLLISRRNRALSRAHLGKIVAASRLDEEFEKLVHEAKAADRTQESDRGSRFTLMVMLWRRELRIPTLLSILVMIGQQFTGIAAIFAYSSDIFAQASIAPREARFCTMGIGIAYFLCTLPSPILIERLGRRFLLLFQLIGCTVSLIALSLFIGLAQNGYAWGSTASIGALGVYMCIYGVGSPIPWLIASELFEQRYRSMAVSIGTFSSFACAFVISMSYLSFQRAVGPALSFLPFIVVMCIVIVTMAVFLPETKNRSIDDIVSEFRIRRKKLRSLTSSFRRSSMNHDPASLLTSEEKKRLAEDYGQRYTHANYGTSGDEP